MEIVRRVVGRARWDVADDRGAAEKPREASRQDEPAVPQSNGEYTRPMFTRTTSFVVSPLRTSR